MVFFLFWVFLGLDILKYNELVYFVEVYGYGYIECFIQILENNLIVVIQGRFLVFNNSIGIIVIIVLWIEIILEFVVIIRLFLYNFIINLQFLFIFFFNVFNDVMIYMLFQDLKIWYLKER